MFCSKDTKVGCTPSTTTNHAGFWSAFWAPLVPQCSEGCRLGRQQRLSGGALLAPCTQIMSELIFFRPQVLGSGTGGGHFAKLALRSANMGGFGGLGPLTSTTQILGKAD